MSVSLYQQTGFATCTSPEDSYPGRNVFINNLPTNACVTVPAYFNDQAQSADWLQSSIPSGYSICFFDNVDCSGLFKCWNQYDNPPSDFNIDGIANRVSAVMVTSQPGNLIPTDLLMTTGSPVSFTGSFIDLWNDPVRGESPNSGLGWASVLDC